MIDKKRNYNEGLTPKLICKAISGVEDAHEKNFEHYEPYIIKLSKISYYDDEGRVKLVLLKKKEKESTVNTYKELGKIKKIDRDVVDRFIDEIIISREGRAEIKWNFENIFEFVKSA